VGEPLGAACQCLNALPKYCYKMPEIVLCEEEQLPRRRKLDSRSNAVFLACHLAVTGILCSSKPIRAFLGSRRRTARNPSGLPRNSMLIEPCATKFTGSSRWVFIATGTLVLPQLYIRPVISVKTATGGLGSLFWGEMAGANEGIETRKTNYRYFHSFANRILSTIRQTVFHSIFTGLAYVEEGCPVT